MNNPLLVSGAPAEDGPLMMDDSLEKNNPANNDDEDSTSDDSDSDSDDDDSGSEYSDDSDSSDLSSGMEDLEAALRLGTRQKDMKRSLSSPAMSAIFSHVNTKKEPKGMSQAETLAGLHDLAARMKKSQSTAYMQAAAPVKVVETVEDPFAATDPDDFLQQLLEGISAKSFPSETWHDYFQTMTPEHIGAYTTEMVQAIRNDEYDYLRERLRNGHTLQCCNTHGESILHLVCRRGSEDMLRFLMEEAGVSVRIRDDKGRTPFHDACWTTNPKFDLVYALLESSPELLFVQDHRGHTPLSYAPRQCWGQWNGFLQKNRIFLRASVRSLRFDRAKYLVRSVIPCMK